MKYEPNMGELEKILRLILGIYFLPLGFFFFQGPSGILIGIVGIAFILTSLSGWCPLYTLLGRNHRLAEVPAADAAPEESAKD
jgi:hypothetical protein